MIFGFSITELLVIAPAIVGVFSIIATATPNKSDDKIVAVILKIVNLLGQNYGKAANKDEKKSQ